MSELFDKEMNAQKESLKKLRGFTQAHKKVCDENDKRNKKKRRARKSVIDGREALYRALTKNS